MDLKGNDFVLEGFVQYLKIDLGKKMAEVHIQQIVTNEVMTFILPSDQAADIEQNKSYVFCNLARQGKNFRWAETSRVFLSA